MPSDYLFTVSSHYGPGAVNLKGQNMNSITITNSPRIQEDGSNSDSHKLAPRNHTFQQVLRVNLRRRDTIQR